MNNNGIPEQDAHALYSPSAIYRNMNCIGSLAVNKEAKKLGLIKESAYAKWGTDCHEYAAEALTVIHSQNKYDFNKIIDPEKRELVQNYCGFIGNINAAFRKTHEGVKHYIEHRVIWDNTFWGTADYILTGFNKRTAQFDCIFADLKTGVGVEVSAEDNEQLAGYAICLAKTLGKKFDRVHAFIYQPRTPGKEFTKWEIDRATLDAYAEKILLNKAECIEHLADTSLGDAAVGDKCNPGEWCKFCPGKEFHNGMPLCNSFAKDANSTALKILDKVPEVPVIEKLSVEQKIEVFKRRKIIKQLLDDICSDLLQTALKQPIEGYKVVEGQRRRSWIKGDIETQATILEELGVENPVKKSLVGIGEVEKQIGKGKIDDLTQLSKPSYQLVPEDDKRLGITQVGLESITEIDLD